MGEGCEGWRMLRVFFVEESCVGSHGDEWSDGWGGRGRRDMGERGRISICRERREGEGGVGRRVAGWLGERGWVAVGGVC